ncbi:unnamed protein product [Periconia digitata]|uniref:Uncharacterized protein n=1 Tax=Periconia digitata TaxID=1303443 RepID=A0A9W4XF74_9PLEO|nr:unnamed protein product [Periconia digitata]
MFMIMILRMYSPIWVSLILPVASVSVFWNDTSPGSTTTTTTTGSLANITLSTKTSACQTTVTQISPYTKTAIETRGYNVVTRYTTITKTRTYYPSTSSPNSSIRKRDDPSIAGERSGSRTPNTPDTPIFTQPPVSSGINACLTITTTRMPTYTVTTLEIEQRTSILTETLIRSYFITPPKPTFTETTTTQNGNDNKPEPPRTSTWSSAITTLPIPEPGETFSLPPDPTTSFVLPTPSVGQPTVLPSSRTPVPIGTFMPLPHATNPGNPVTSSPGLGLHLGNGATLLPGSATTLSNQVISLPATPSFIQINGNTFPLLPSATFPPNPNPPSSPPQNGDKPNPSSGAISTAGKPTYTVSTAPLPFSLLSTYLLNGTKGSNGGGEAKPLFSLTLPDGHILSISPEDLKQTSDKARKTYTYKGHLISLSYNPGIGEVELMVDDQRISSFSPILASSVLRSGDAIFSFESVIGGAVRLFDGEVGLVSVNGMGGDGDIGGILGIEGVSLVLEHGGIVVTSNQGGGGEGGTNHVEKESAIRSTTSSGMSTLFTELPNGLFSTGELSVPGATQTSSPSAVASDSFGETRFSFHGKKVLGVWLMGYLAVI